MKQLFALFPQPKLGRCPSGSKLKLVLLGCRSVNQQLSPAEIVNAVASVTAGERRGVSSSLAAGSLLVLATLKKGHKKFLRGQMESMRSTSRLVSVWPNHLVGALIRERK